jgi:hypothetical protein
MNVYEAIIMILEKKGPATIPSIWEEIAKLPSDESGGDQFFNVTQLKSIIGLKREWFRLNGDLVSLRPERDPVKLMFKLSGYPGPEVKISVDFKRNTFVFLEWNYNRQTDARILPHYQHGSVCEFKKDLYSLHIWDWDKDYQSDGIIVDGLSWSIVLETKGAVYRSEGLDTFPSEWRMFCRSLSRLTGVAIK